MVEDMSKSEQNYTYCLLLTTTTNQTLPTSAKLTPPLPNGAISIAYSAGAVDLEDPLFLVNRVTERLELARAARHVDGNNRRRLNGSTIVGNDLSDKYSLIGNFDTLESSHDQHVNSQKTTNIRFQNQSIKSCEGFTADSPESILTNLDLDPPPFVDVIYSE